MDYKCNIIYKQYRSKRSHPLFCIVLHACRTVGWLG
ncbi:hypothetical protein OIU76_013033 [Salix suchowensis]|nr:hypothetical protein OIU76_013033 [Salix suchowensis]